MERASVTEAARSSAARSSAEVEPPPLPTFSPVRRTRGSATQVEQTPPPAAVLGSSRGSARMAASAPSGKGLGGREKFAGMAIGEKDDPQRDITLDLVAVARQQVDDPLGDISPKSDASSESELAAPLEPEAAEPQLPLVDPFEDHDNVWVMLDEGCNQTCHGTRWRKHSEEVLSRRHGLRFLPQQQSGTSFKGIGAAKAVGRYSLPFALQISQETASQRRNTRLQGELTSTELDSPDVLCLLSLQDQVQLGLVKDLRRGECKISGYAGKLQLARHVKTGLLLLNMSQFGANVTKRHKKFALDTSVVISKKTPRRTFSIPRWNEQPSIPSRDEAMSAYMLSELVREKENQHKKVLLVSFGLERLEYSHRSRKVYTGLTKLINSFPRAKSYEFSLDSKNHEDILLESLRTNFSRF